MSRRPVDDARESVQSAYSRLAEIAYLLTSQESGTFDDDLAHALVAAFSAVKCIEQDVDGLARAERERVSQ